MIFLDLNNFHSLLQTLSTLSSSGALQEQAVEETDFLTQIYPLHVKRIHHQGNHLLPGHLVRWEKKVQSCEYYYLSSISICNVQLSVLEVLLKIKCIKIKIDTSPCL